MALLAHPHVADGLVRRALGLGRILGRLRERELGEGLGALEAAGVAEGARQVAVGLAAQRSEERRGGQECVSTCRSRWSPDPYTTQQEERMQQDVIYTEHCLPCRVTYH